jgi:hypothetical protein
VQVVAVRHQSRKFYKLQFAAPQPVFQSPSAAATPTTVINTSAESSDNTDVSSLGCSPLPASPVLSYPPSVQLRPVGPGGLQLQQPALPLHQAAVGFPQLANQTSPRLAGRRLPQQASRSVLRPPHPTSRSVLRLSQPTSRPVVRIPPQQLSFDNVQEKVYWILEIYNFY